MKDKDKTNITKKLLFKTAPVRCRLSRLMHWWTGFISLSISGRDRWYETSFFRNS